MGTDIVKLWNFLFAQYHSRARRFLGSRRRDGFRDPVGLTKVPARHGHLLVRTIECSIREYLREGLDHQVDFPYWTSLVLERLCSFGRRFLVGDELSGRASYIFEDRGRASATAILLVA